MVDNLIYTELFKAGLKTIGDSITQVISNINKSKLEERKKRQEKEIGTSPTHLLESEKVTGRVDLDIDKAIESVENHLEEIKHWAHVIKFGDLDKKKTLGAVYVQLDTYLMPVKKHFSLAERNRTTPLETAVLTGEEHCVILGQPGAGKTTSLKKVCELVLKDRSKSSYTIPLLLRMKDLGEIRTKTPILDHVAKIIPLKFEFREGKSAKTGLDVEMAKEDAIFKFLNFIKPIIILDGYDELRDSAAKGIVLDELRKFSTKLTNAKFILSCRTGEFNYELDHANTYEIAPLNDAQIELFVNKWLNDKEKAADFLLKVKNSPFADTSIKPLSLAHLCAIYERINNIPDQPKTIYRKVVGLLIEEWDEQRSIIRKSAFEGFASDQKFEFLTHLSFFLTTTYKSSLFTVDQFKTAYENLYEYHGLPAGKATSVVKELESHTGLFIESGYEKFEFVHKSIQEYLAADYLVKLPSLNSVKSEFETLGSELAIAVSISSNSSLYYIELILNYFSRAALSNSFYSSFISRIISENPTFSNNELVGPATLVLISNWINPGNKNFNLNKASFVNEDFYNIFSRLAESLRFKEQKAKIFKYYDYVSDVHDNQFVEMVRIKEPANHKRLPSKMYLPMRIYLEIKA